MFSLVKGLQGLGTQILGWKIWYLHMTKNDHVLFDERTSKSIVNAFLKIVHLGNLYLNNFFSRILIICVVYIYLPCQKMFLVKFIYLFYSFSNLKYRFVNYVSSKLALLLIITLKKKSCWFFHIHLQLPSYKKESNVWSSRI